MHRILVTGHAGFIGFHLAQKLLSQGHLVLGIDAVTDYYDSRLKRARLEILSDHSNLDSHEFYLEDASRLQETVAAFEPSIVVHLAAQAGVRYSLEHPEKYVSSNIVGTFNLLETMREIEPAHLMLASTSSVYGGNEKLPFAETDRADSPVSLYAASKKASEAMAHSYSHLWGIPTTAFRFFTVYGPWGRPDMALFKFVKAIRSGETIDVYGQGLMQRDFTYVDDLVESIVSLSEQPPQMGATRGSHDSLSPVAPFRMVNIGGGSPIGLLDFIQAIEAALGTRAKMRMLPMQPGDVEKTASDITLLEDLVGDRPRTPVQTGVGHFVRWYNEYYGENSSGL